MPTEFSLPNGGTGKAPNFRNGKNIDGPQVDVTWQGGSKTVIIKITDCNKYITIATLNKGTGTLNQNTKKENFKIDQNAMNGFTKDLDANEDWDVFGMDGNNLMDPIWIFKDKKHATKSADGLDGFKKKKKKKRTVLAKKVADAPGGDEKKAAGKELEEFDKNYKKEVDADEKFEEKK